MPSRSAGRAGRRPAPPHRRGRAPRHRRRDHAGECVEQDVEALLVHEPARGHEAGASGLGAPGTARGHHRGARRGDVDADVDRVHAGGVEADLEHVGDQTGRDADGRVDALVDLRQQRPQAGRGPGGHRARQRALDQHDERLAREPRRRPAEQQAVPHLAARDDDVGLADLPQRGRQDARGRRPEPAHLLRAPADVEARVGLVHRPVRFTFSSTRKRTRAPRSCQRRARSAETRRPPLSRSAPSRTRTRGPGPLTQRPWLATAAAAAAAAAGSRYSPPGTVGLRSASRR